MLGISSAEKGYLFDTDNEKRISADGYLFYYYIRVKIHSYKIIKKVQGEFIWRPYLVAENIIWFESIKRQ